ncbi:LysR family transcriptional regulator [Phenylobacterium sp. LjRoot225]|uniref:LysR family transcriptional regulator n=1 Tax=Phenylobacterium sp. LjRoot225 TaxID=3342285 RepID=UPI003ECC42B5
MDFKRLGYFITISEHGSLSRAAEHLHIAQPSLSRQMRLLEEELGVVLFTRGRRGMQLTEAGETLRARITGPLRQVGHALNEVRALPSEPGGTVVFGMPPTTVYVLAGPLARRVASFAPNISLQIVDGSSGPLLDGLQRGKLDAAILYGPPTPVGVNAAKLLEDELMLVGPPDSPLRPDQPVDFARLAELPLVLPSHPHGLRMALDAAATKARCKLNVKIQADSSQLMKELVESGLGYTALPVSSFNREAVSGRLTWAPIVNPKVTRQLFLAMQSSAESPRAVLQVEEFVRQEVAALAADGRWPVARLFDIGDS